MNLGDYDISCVLALIYWLKVAPHEKNVIVITIVILTGSECVKTCFNLYANIVVYNKHTILQGGLFYYL